MMSWARALPRVAKFAMLVMMSGAPAYAQWTGKGEAGVAVASGNTQSKTANAKVALGLKDDRWEHSASLSGLYVRNSGDTTAQRWEVSGQTRFSFSRHTFWFGGLRYEEDRFSGFNHQGVVTTGIGRKFIDTERTKISGQVGLGYKFSRIPDGSPDSSDDGTSTGVLSLDVDHRLNGSTSLFNHFGAETTSDNNFLRNEVGVSVKMSDRLALAVAYSLRYNTDPPAGFQKRDSLSTINLVYEVK